MDALFVGKNLIFLPAIESTNSYAIELLKNVKVEEGTVVQAEYQTMGRGQRGVSWLAEPASNLTLSTIFFPNFLKVEESFYLYIIAALACYDTTAQLLTESHVELRIKWPNDIYVNGLKNCGILIENKLNADYLFSTVIGIGINVNQEEFKGLNAGSLKMFSGKKFSLDQVRNLLCFFLEKYYLSLKSGQYENLKTLYTSRMLGLGEVLDFSLNGERKKMKVLGISDDGLLRLEDDTKILHKDLGEIKWLL